MDRHLPSTPMVVNITLPGLTSRQGKYFIAQTDELTFGKEYDAWGGIINPVHSGVNLYFDIFTITNNTTQSYTSEIWLNAKAPYNAAPSPTVTASNQAIIPSPKPKCIMEEAQYITDSLQQGVNIFDRIVPPNSTLVSDSHQGSIVIGPGGSFSILLKSAGPQTVTGIIVLTWWEERIA